MKKECSITDCVKPSLWRGWCNMHSQRYLRTGDPEGHKLRPDTSTRFWAKVTKTDTCWLWTGGVNTTGYGTFWATNSKSVVSHRWSYEQTFGPLPDGLTLDHLCRVRNCVRPDHLDPVTHMENVRRGEAGSTNRDKKYCRWGHPYDSTNTYRAPRGGRFCRICVRAAKQRYRLRKKGIATTQEAP